MKNSSFIQPSFLLELMVEVLLVNKKKDHLEAERKHLVWHWREIDSLTLRLYTLTEKAVSVILSNWETSFRKYHPDTDGAV